MRHWIVGIVCLLSALSGPPATSQPARGADPAIWEGEEAAGPIRHRASNVSLPAELEGFARAEVRAISAEDVAASYQATDGSAQTRITVYLFRPGSLPEHRLRGSVSAFATLSPQAFVWSAGPFDIHGDPGLHGYKGTYKTGVGPGTVLDYLYFLELGAWTVKVRATLSGEGQDEAQEGRIDAFVRGLPWQQILAANGGCTGSACSAPAFEPMYNHFAQTVAARLLLRLAPADARAEARLPVEARHDVPLVGPMEIRRSDGNPLLYVAEVPNLATYRLVRIPEVANRLFTEAFGRLSIDKPVYALTLRSGGEDLMARLYHGTPTAEAFGAAVDQLVLEAMPPPMVPVADHARTLPE